MQTFRTLCFLLVLFSPPASGRAMPPTISGSLDPDQVAIVRGDWLNATLEIIEAADEVIPNPEVSQDEWRCQIAERQFSRIDQRRYPHGNLTLEVHNLRIRWAEEVVFFYCLSQPFAETHDDMLHRELLARHTTERFSWRPTHALPGPCRKSPRQYRSRSTGLTQNWLQVDDIQALRRRLMPLFIRRDEALVTLVSRDAQEAGDIRSYLRSREHFGEPMLPVFRRPHMMPVEDDRFLMRLLRGFRDEAYLFADASIGFPERYCLHASRALMRSGAIASKTLYEENLSE